MRILIADDDRVARHLLTTTLANWGFDIIACGDGVSAWQRLQGDGAPRLAILDWMMPGLHGIEVCRHLRAVPGPQPYILLLTARGDREDIIGGLEAGADDYVTKPFDEAELRARVQVGIRVLELQQRLAERIAELEVALSRVKQLGGLLPICCYCKKIRNDQNYWQQVERYVSDHSDAQFSHAICPQCYDTVVEQQFLPTKIS